MPSYAGCSGGEITAATRLAAEDEDVFPPACSLPPACPRRAGGLSAYIGRSLISGPNHSSVPKRDDPLGTHRRSSQPPLAGRGGGVRRAPQAAGLPRSQRASARPEETLHAEPEVILSLSSVQSPPAPRHGRRLGHFPFVACGGLFSPAAGCPPSAPRPPPRTPQNGTLLLWR